VTSSKNGLLASLKSEDMVQKLFPDLLGRKSIFISVARVHTFMILTLPFGVDRGGRGTGF